MRTHSPVRNRRNVKDKKSYRLVAPADLWAEVQATADHFDLSLAHFIRESIRHNLAAYRKAQVQ